MQIESHKLHDRTANETWDRNGTRIGWGAWVWGSSRGPNTTAAAIPSGKTHYKLSVDFRRTPICGKVTVVDSDSTAAFNYPNTAVPFKEPSWPCSCVESKAPHTWHYGFWDGCCYRLTASATNVNNQDTYEFIQQLMPFLSSIMRAAQVICSTISSSNQTLNEMAVEFKSCWANCYLQ